MDGKPDQPALFQIEGPDEDGCVWDRSTEGCDVPEPWTEGSGGRGALPVARRGRCGQELLTERD